MENDLDESAIVAEFSEKICATHGIDITAEQKWRLAQRGLLKPDGMARALISGYGIDPYEDLKWFETLKNEYANFVRRKTGRDCPW